MPVPGSSTGLVAWFCAGLLAASPVAGAPAEEALARCRTLPAHEPRLACYDAIPLAAAARDGWQGRNGTEAFDLEAAAGDVLVIEHDDAILVGALKDASGALLENLHLAGRGTLTVPIAAAGRYTVSLSATGQWSARLKPQR